MRDFTLFDGWGSSTKGGDGDDHITVHTKSYSKSDPMGAPSFIYGGSGDDTVEVYGDGQTMLYDDVETVVEHDGMKCEEYKDWWPTKCSA